MPIKHENNRYDLRNDNIFKKFFGNPKNLKPLKLLIEALTDLEIKELFLNSTEKIVKMKESDKNDYRKILVDLLVETEEGRKINVEMQQAHQRNFLKRTVFYLSNIYIDNYGRESGENPYDGLRSCISINILGHTEFKDDVEAASCYTLLNRKTHRDFIEKDFLSIYFLELTKHSQDPNIQLWIELFTKGELVSEATEEFEDIVMKSYDELQLTKAEEREALRQEIARADEIDRMDAALEKGEAIGLEKGEAIGLEKGEVKRSLEMIKSLRDSNVDEEVIRKSLGKNFEYLLDESSK